MHRDYIFAVADNGKVVVTNRRGQTRIEPENNFKNQPLSQFYLNRTNSKAPFITSDITGKLTYLRTNGKTSVTDFGDFTKQHIFSTPNLTKTAILISSIMITIRLRLSIALKKKFCMWI